VAGNLNTDYPLYYQHAAIWQNGGIKDLGTLGGPQSAANGLNDLGQVVGSAASTDGSTHCFLWQDGVMTDLGVYAPVSCVATGINNLGQILIEGGPNNHAFLWDSGMATDLTAVIIQVGWRSVGQLTAINDHGQIVGKGTTANRQIHAFLMTPEETPAVPVSPALRSLTAQVFPPQGPSATPLVDALVDPLPQTSPVWTRQGTQTGAELGSASAAAWRQPPASHWTSPDMLAGPAPSVLGLPGANCFDLPGLDLATGL
jgi:probable HAF family extracellular repeat protein